MASSACVRAIRIFGRPLRVSRNAVPSNSRTFCDSKKDDKLDRLDELLKSFSIEKRADAPKVTVAKPPKEKPITVRGVAPQVVQAAKAAAKTLPGDIQENHMRLLQELQNVNKESGALPLDELLGGIRVYRSSKQHKVNVRPNEELDNQMDVQDSRDVEYSGVLVTKTRDRARLNRLNRDLSDTFQKFPLFEGPDLGIFESITEVDQVAKPVTMLDKLVERETRAALTVPPKNAIEEMITWTESGKLWKFPIDNEAGLDHEATVSFEDHVFLDHLIQDDAAFPQGPVRDFMELVCVGLSKNPYITVERKHACIEWYRDYFTKKSELIKAAAQSQ